MRRRVAGVVLGLLTGSACALLPSTSRAGPSNSDVDGAFGHLGMEMRAACGVAPSFGNNVVYGGDGHFLIEGSEVAILFGGRLLTDGSTRQIATGELGGRYFFPQLRPIGLFGGGGAFYGAEYVDDLAFAIGHVGGAYAEVGVELPRTWLFRLTGSVRADLGYASKTEFSRIEPAAGFAMFSLNVGFFFGGRGTAVESTRAGDTKE